MNSNDFFRTVKAGNSTVADPQVISHYVNAAAGLSRCCICQSVCLIDHESKGFLYVSDNPVFLCGYSIEQVLVMGYDFYIKQVPVDDLRLLSLINTESRFFYENLSIEERSQYTISYDFRLLQSPGNHILINHKLTPLITHDNGEICLSLCVASISFNTSPGNIVIYRKGEKSIYYSYNIPKKKWESAQNIWLTEREKKLLLLSAQGYSNKDIANELYRSIETIKSIKQNLFAKLSVKNITSALAYAINSNLI